MGRMDIQGSPTIELEIPYFLGQNTADSFSRINNYQSPKMMNCLPNKIGGIAQRPGTKPLTASALANPIKQLFNFRKNGTNNILCTANDTLYKFDGTDTLTGQTMTNVLATADIDQSQFKDENGDEVLIIADGGNLKYYDGTTVQDITPATDDGSGPANDLATINTDQPPIGCIVHNTRVVIWDNSDTIHHSKIGYYDYFPDNTYQRFVRENDYVVTCVSFAGALLVLMRRHIGVLFGDGYASTPSAGDWSQDFLDTTKGCMNSNTVQTVLFPDGRQEIFYLTDNGVESIHTIATRDQDQSTLYATRSITDAKVKWDDLGVTDAEWAKASAHFYEGKYWLIYPKGSEWLGLVFDTTNEEWYPVNNIVSNSLYHDEDYFYYAGDEGHLRVFDEDLYSDYEDNALASGTPINAYWYSKLLTPGITGYDHFWDVLMIEARQFYEASSIDVEVNTFKGQYNQSQAIKTTILIWGETAWGEGQWANENFTDLINNAQRLRTFEDGLKGQYAQIKLSNNRDEPFEVFTIKYEVRYMTKY